MATRGGTSLELTGREFKLLEYLIVNRGTVHIARIRRKIDDPFHIKPSPTVSGVAFVLRAMEEN